MYIRVYDSDRKMLYAGVFGKETFLPSIEAIKAVPTIVINERIYKVGWMETVLGDDREDRVTCVDVIIDDPI